MRTVLFCLLVLFLGTTCLMVTGCESTSPDVTGAKTSQVSTPEKPAPNAKAAPASAQHPGKGDLGADKFVHDFGAVTPATKVNCEFLLINKGNKVLKIKKPGSSCGCTVAKLETRTLAPSQSIPLQITFKTPRTAGKTSKRVWVEAEPPSKPQRINFTIKAEVAEVVKAKPAKLSFELRNSDEITIPLVLESTDDTPFNVTGFVDRYRAVSVVFDKGIHAKQHTVTVKADPQKIRKSKRGSLTINVNHPKIPTVAIPYQVTLPFVAKPSTRTFFAIKPGVPQKATLRIVSSFQQPFELSPDIHSNKGFVKVLGVIKRDDGYLLNLEMTVPEGFKGTRADDTLTINIKDRPQDSITVHCYGRLKK